MSSPQFGEIQETPREGINFTNSLRVPASVTGSSPSTSSRVSVSSSTANKRDEGAGAGDAGRPGDLLPPSDDATRTLLPPSDNAPRTLLPPSDNAPKTLPPPSDDATKTSLPPSDDAPKTSLPQPIGTIAAQSQSIWCKYVTTAYEKDQKVIDKWKTSMNNILLFAALFTAIVTAFVLDAMSDLNESTEAQLLRILVEQSVINPATVLPPSEPSSSTLTVSTLWLLSIMSSLVATTWAILCLEWCTFLPDGIKADDYEEMAKKRQRRWEAVERWKVEFIITAIPSLLQLSLFLFLTGLWLRLQDINKQLGLVIGVPSLVLASSYVVVTILPIFTDAPFPTSTSQLIKLVLEWFMEVIESRIVYPLRHLINGQTAPLQSNQNPLEELHKLKVGPADQDKGIYLRALFWLVNTPLSKDEVKEVLQEFEKHGSPGKPLDRSTIRLLVLSLSSVLGDDLVSKEEEPIFDHCTAVLAEEMDRAFGSEVYNQEILFRNTAVSEKLPRHFRLDASGEDALSKDHYWKRATAALWLCPSADTIRPIVDQLDRNVKSIKAPQLQLIVRGLHAATISCFNAGQFTFELIPDFSLWSWDSGSSDPALDKALSGFLHNLFAAYFTTLIPFDQPTTISSLIVKCLQLLDEQLGHLTYAFNLHSALCFFVTVIQRSNPEVLEEGFSVVRVFLESVPSCRLPDDQYNSERTSVLVTRLRAIAYGPKSPISKESQSLKTLSDLYAKLPDSVKTNQKCLEGFLDAYAATLEATLAVGRRVVESTWKDSPDYLAAQNICTTDSLFTHKTPIDQTPRYHVHQCPNRKLQYLYSLAIALSYTTGDRNRELWGVAELLELVTHDSLPLIKIHRALDINILVVTILRFAPSDKLEPAEEERKRKLLELLKDTATSGGDWKTRWKSIYLVADLACLFSETSDKDKTDEAMEPFIKMASGLLEGEGPGPVPSDWRKKKDGLRLCKVKAKVKVLISTRGLANEAVYEWNHRERVPFLSLYGSRRIPTEPISNAKSWVRRRLHRPEAVQQTAEKMV